MYCNIRRVREYAFRVLLTWSNDITPRCHTLCCCWSKLYIQDVTESYCHYMVLRYVFEELYIYTSTFHVSTLTLLVTHDQKSSAHHNICNCRLTNSVSYIVCRHIYSRSTLRGNTSLTALHLQINNQQNTRRTGKFTPERATKAQRWSRGIALLFL